MGKSFFNILTILLTLSFLTACLSNKSSKQEKAALPAILSDTADQASCIFMTKNEKGIPMISWIEVDQNHKKHFYFSIFRKEKNIFSEPKPIPINQKASTNEEAKPKVIAKGDGTLLAEYEVNIPRKDSKWGHQEIHYIQSMDGGESWSHPKPISVDFAKGQSGSFANIARLSDGEIGICWLGGNPKSNNGGRPVKFIKTKGSKGFEQEITIDPKACECCGTAISCDENGNISIAYRDLLPGSIRDISLSRSSDNGHSFSEAISSTHDYWEVNGCPHSGPAVMNNNGKSFITWFTGKKENAGINFAEIDSTGELIQQKHLNYNGRYSQMAQCANHVQVIVYNEEFRENNQIISRIKLEKITPEGHFEKTISFPGIAASYPALQAINNEQVLLSWTNAKTIRYKVIDLDTISSPKAETQPLLKGLPSQKTMHQEHQL